VVSLSLQFADHHEREHHAVLGEPGQRPGVREQYGGVQHVDVTGGGGTTRCAAGGTAGRTLAGRTPGRTRCGHGNSLTNAARRPLSSLGRSWPLVQRSAQAVRRRGPGAGPLALITATTRASRDEPHAHDPSLRKLPALRGVAQAATQVIRQVVTAPIRPRRLRAPPLRRRNSSSEGVRSVLGG
jgi:hypothetical protein